MDIDIYQPCPCHSGKKIKFCCSKEIIGDLNEIMSLTKAKQPHAALEKIDRVIARSGEKDCLQILKSGVLINLNEIDQAEVTNEKFLQVKPNHPMGHHHRALIYASRGQSEQAVNALQDALESIKDVNVPVPLANSFRIVGMLLLSNGHVMASRAHFRFAMSLRRDDELLEQLYSETWRLPGLPLMLRHEFGIYDAPTDQPWSEQFHQAQVLAGAGRWRKARKLLQELASQHDNVPRIQKGIAILATWLGLPDLSDDWETLSKNEDIPLDDAVDAKSFQLLLGDEPLTDSCDVTRDTFELNDVNAVLEKVTANSRCETFEIDRNQADEADDQPLPKSGFVVLDREPGSSDSVELDTIPVIVAEAFVYAKQTDRAARIELVSVGKDQQDSARHFVQTEFGQWIDGDYESNTVGDIPLIDHRLNVRLKIPKSVTPGQYRDLMTEQREQLYLEVWPEIPFNVLDGKTPKEASANGDLKIELMALIGILEQSADRVVFESFDFSRLRDQLGLPSPTEVDPDREDFGNLSPAMQMRLPFEKLDDQQLTSVYARNMAIGNLSVVRKTSLEILNRESITDNTGKSGILWTLAQVTSDDQQAIDYAKQAREAAVAEGENEGFGLVEELRIRLERGVVEGCNELIRVLRARFQGDQEVELHLLSTLQRFGLIGPQGQIPELPESSPQDLGGESASGGESKSTIWTPDQGTAEAGGGKSKLWVPE